jgi:hypothetical protein
MTMQSKSIDWNGLAVEFERQLSLPLLRKLANQLGVIEDSLTALQVGRTEIEQAWTFPERDACGNVIGILRRFEDGRKQLMAGGKRGIYLPCNLSLTHGKVYVPEGASDVAALLSCGLQAVGRPSCRGGFDLLHQLFAGANVEVLIVGENDEKPDGRWPGRDGAKQMASKLAAEGINAVWTLPPKGIKDVRDYVVKEGAENAR